MFFGLIICTDECIANEFMPFANDFRPRSSKWRAKRLTKIVEEMKGKKANSKWATEKKWTANEKKQQ